MTYGITLIVLGILAVPSLLLSKRPDASEWLDKITPYQGWIGILFGFWGLWGVLGAIRTIGLMDNYPIWWFTLLACTVVQTLIGFLLGYGLLSKYVFSKSEAAKEKGAMLLAKISPLQGKLGILAIALGSWVIIAHFLYRLA